MYIYIKHMSKSYEESLSITCPWFVHGFPDWKHASPASFCFAVFRNCSGFGKWIIRRCGPSCLQLGYGLRWRWWRWFSRLREAQCFFRRCDAWRSVSCQGGCKTRPGSHRSTLCSTVPRCNRGRMPRDAKGCQQLGSWAAGMDSRTHQISKCYSIRWHQMASDGNRWQQMATSAFALCGTASGPNCQVTLGGCATVDAEVSAESHLSLLVTSDRAIKCHQYVEFRSCSSILSTTLSGAENLQTCSGSRMNLDMPCS